MRSFIVVLLVCYCELLYAQRIPAYDSISTAQQDYPCVVQTLDDGTLLMAAVSRPWLSNGKGSLLLVRMDMLGNPLYHHTFELPDVGINNAGGIFKTGPNQYTIFCTFDTTYPTFANKPTHVGYIQTDTLFHISKTILNEVPKRNTATSFGIYDLKVKRQKQDLFFARLGIHDNAPGFTSPFIFNLQIDLRNDEIHILPDTVRKWKNWYNNTGVSGYYSSLPMDFLSCDSTNTILLLEKSASNNITDFLYMNIRDSVYYTLFSHEAINLQDTLMVYDYKFERLWRTNMLFYKNKFILMGGTGTCRGNFDLIDTLYKNNPGQSGLTMLVFDTTLFKTQYNHPFEYPYPYRFTFVEDIREAFYDTTTDAVNTLYRLYGDNYSSAYMQCLDYWDENKIYYGRQLGDVVNVQRSYNSFPSLLLISQFDSTLHKVWERRIPARNREGIVSVNATPDGGVILTTRSSTGPLDDPQFPGIQMHKFDIAVYKFNQHGVITSLNKLIESENQKKHSLYPNPANQYVHIKGDVLIATLQVWDTQGKQYSVNFNVENQIIVIDTLPVGIYFVQLYNSNNELLNVLKLVKN
jgi:hypothetical protein